MKKAKTWDQLSDKEKIEQLHEEIRGLRFAISVMSDYARKAEALASEHQHGADGKPLFPRHVIERCLPLVKTP